MAIFLNGLLFRIAKHWIAGETYEEAIARSEPSNVHNVLGIINILGEEIGSREHIKTSARPFRTLDTFFPEDPTPMDSLKQALDESKNQETVMRLRLKGRVTAEQLSKYRRSELILYAEGRFFHLTVDESELEIEFPATIPALPRTTPLEELRRYFTSAIALARAEEKEILEEALRICQAKLEEAGAW